MHMNLKKKNDLAQVVQQQTNNVPRAKKLRMSWTPLVHEKFVESVQELGDIESINLFPNLNCINSLFSHSSHLSFHAKHFVHALRLMVQVGQKLYISLLTLLSEKYSTILYGTLIL